MKATCFMKGVGVALAAALGGSSIMFALAGVVAMPLLLRATVVVIGLVYVLYVLACARVRAGKLSALLAWALFTAVTLALNPPLFAHLCTQVGFVWLLRAVCVHRSALPALVDLALCSLSVLAALWAVERTGSMFIAIWCLMLVQAAYVAIPRRKDPTDEAGGSCRGVDERFAHAQRTADAALRRLSTKH